MFDEHHTDREIQRLDQQADHLDYLGKHKQASELRQESVALAAAEAQRRIALDADDTVALGKPLSFPAKDKVKDSRYPWFVKHYGDTCWELDALSPSILRDRLALAIESVIDWESWERHDVSEEAELTSLNSVLDWWAKESA